MIDRNEVILQGTVAASTVTQAENLTHHQGYLIKGKWTGSGITGLAKLRCGTDGTEWEDLTDSEVKITAAGGIVWEVEEKRYPWVQVWMQSLSGSITFTATLVLSRESKIG